MGESLWRMGKKGLAASWPDPLPKWRNRLRWYSPKHRPAKCPPPSGVLPKEMLRQAAEKAGIKAVVTKVGAVKVTKYVTCQIDKRYQVAPGEKVTGAGFSAMPMGTYLSE